MTEEVSAFLVRIDAFRELVSELRKRVDKDVKYYNRNEDGVKKDFIELVLRSLDWPDDLVRAQERAGRGLVDYCLKLPDGREGLCIEAKKMSIKPKGDAFNKLTDYCVSKSVEYGLWSNGRQWVLICALKGGKRPEWKEVWRTDIVEDCFDTLVCRNLFQISYENLPKLSEIVQSSHVVEEIIDFGIKESFPEIVRGVCMAVKSDPRYYERSFPDEYLNVAVYSRLSVLRSANKDNEPVRGPKPQPEGKKKKRVKLSELVGAGLLRDGETLFFVGPGRHQNEKAKIVSRQNQLRHKGKLYSPSALAQQLLNSKDLQGPLYWRTRDGKKLSQINDEYRASKGCAK